MGKFLGKVSHFISGRLRKVLRDHRPQNQSQVRGQSRHQSLTQQVQGQTKSKPFHPSSCPKSKFIAHCSMNQLWSSSPTSRTRRMSTSSSGCVPTSRSTTWSSVESDSQTSRPDVALPSWSKLPFTCTTRRSSIATSSSETCS